MRNDVRGQLFQLLLGAFVVFIYVLVILLNALLCILCKALRLFVMALGREQRHCTELRAENGGLLLKTALCQLPIILAGLFSDLEKLLLLLLDIGFRGLQVAAKLLVRKGRLGRCRGKHLAVVAFLGNSVLGKLLKGFFALCGCSILGFTLFKAIRGLFCARGHILDAAKRGGKSCRTASLCGGNGILEPLHCAVQIPVQGRSRGIGDRAHGSGLGRLFLRCIGRKQTKRIGNQVRGHHACNARLEHLLFQCRRARRILCDDALNVLIHLLGDRRLVGDIERLCIRRGRRALLCFIIIDSNGFLGRCFGCKKGCLFRKCGIILGRGTLHLLCRCGISF